MIYRELCIFSPGLRIFFISIIDPYWLKNHNNHVFAQDSAICVELGGMVHVCFTVSIGFSLRLPSVGGSASLENSSWVATILLVLIVLFQYKFLIQGRVFDFFFISFTVHGRCSIEG